MKKNRNISSSLVVFNKWTRKSYAAFSSLNKTVKIGHLSIDISNQSVKKSKILGIDINIQNNNYKEDNLLDDLILLLTLPIISITGLFNSIFNIIINSNTNTEYSFNNKKNKYNKDYLYSKPVGNNYVINDRFFYALNLAYKNSTL